MNERIGIAELLAARNLGGTDSGLNGSGKGALWAIFVIILIFAVIWLFGGGLFGINKTTNLGVDGLLGGGAEAEEVRRLRTNDQILAEFYKQKIVNHEQLEDAVKCLNKSIVDTNIITLERAIGAAEKGDFKLSHQEQMDVCKLQQEIETLNCRKIDKEFKQVAFCPDATGCPTTTTAIVGNSVAALNTNIELLIDQLGKVK